MESKVERLDYAALDALIRRARTRRDREIVRLLARAARALAGLAKTTYSGVALRRWAGRF